MELSKEYLVTALHVLFGIEDKHWCFYETDPDWWTLHLWTKRN